MKTIILTVLLCFAQLSFGQDIYSALIGHTFTDDNTIALYFNIHTTSAVSSIPKSQIEVTLSDLNTNTFIPISNYSLISQVKEHVGCDTLNDSWIHQYAASIDLTDPAYSALSTSCVLRGELIVSNRLGGSTTTNGTNKPIYVYDQFERCSKTLSNRNTYRTISNGIFYSCVNQPTSHNLGAFDIAEFDSLSFELINPMIDRQNTTTYKSGFSAKQPLTVANTTNFEFDTITGDFVFYPADTNDNKASVSVKTTEWRKDATGQYQVVGLSVRELLIWVDQCQANNVPRIKGKFQTEICEGEELCFTISTEDKVRVLPPPLPRPNPDSVTIKWNRGIPGASFTVINAKALNQSARFCWTPKVGAASKLPYTFVVTARDNFCPLNGVSSRAFSIFVTPEPKAELDVTKISDSSFRMEVFIPTAHDPKEYRTTMALEHLDGTPILDYAIGNFLRANRHESTFLTDTLIMRKSTPFRIHTTIEGKSNSACATERIDTLNFHTSGIFTADNKALQFYPNPTNGLIEFETQLDVINVYNELGQLLLSVDHALNVDLSHLPPAIYLIVGEADDTTMMGRVVKY
ncbi:MAG: hypothetical protein ACI9JN_000494 [Bacteroidia bacterium]|jgi:hypothetical protein